MSNLSLPTSGSTNWGSGLNAYLEQLSSKISFLERTVSSDNGNIIKNIGYSGTGAVGSLTQSFDSTNKQLKVEGNFFIAGDINTYYGSVKTEYTLPTTGSSHYFVALEYSVDTSTNDPKFEIKTSLTYSDHYKSILLGFYDSKNSKYTKIYYTSSKPVFQHTYDRKTRFVDLDKYGTQFRVQNSTDGITVTPYISSGAATTDTTICNMYLDGLSATTPVTAISNGSFDMNSIVYSGNTIWIADYVDSNVRKCKIESSALKGTTDRFSVFRILINVFGDIVVQKSSDTFNLPDASNNQFIEQLLYNTIFVNDFTITSSGSITDSLEADQLVEVYRFGFGKTDAVDYTPGSTTNTTGSSFAIVPSMVKGLAFSNYDNVWPVLNSKMYLDGVSFYNNSAATNYFKFNYAGTGNLEVSIKDIYAGSTAKPIVLFDKSEIDAISFTTKGYTLSSTESGFTYKKDAVPATESSEKEDEKTILSLGNELVAVQATKITLNTDITIDDKGLNIGEGKQLLYTSDKRRKDNFAPIKDSYLNVVNNVPVLSYTYKGSTKKQVGIIAQDLEVVLDDLQDSFITIQDTAELKNKRSLNETKLIYILWKALQEETLARKELENKVKELINK